MDVKELTAQPRVRLGGALAVAGAGAMLAALLLAGGAPKRDKLGLTDTDLVTAWALPVLRLVSDVAAVGCIGALTAAVYLLPADGGVLRRQGRRATDDATVLAGIWAVAALLHAVVTAVVILGVKLTDLPGRLAEAAALKDVQVVAVSAVLAAVTAAVVSGTTRKPYAGLAFSAAALVPPLLVGHAWTDQIRVPAVGARMLHVLAAAVWVGGLAALVRYARRLRPDDQAAVVQRFSGLALDCAIVVGITGLFVATLHLAGRGGSLGDAVDGLFSRGYGGVVLAKVAAFAAIVTAGFWHRRRTITALREGRPASFWLLAAAELTVMLAAVGLAVALSRTP